jgi:iron complex outermembrane recepter protein
MTLRGGVRYTSEYKSLATHYTNYDTSGACALFESIVPPPELTKGAIGVPCLLNPAFKDLTTSQSFTQGAVTGTVKLTYKFDDQNMMYASYSRGNLVGGYNLAQVTTAIGATPNASLVPETNTFFPAEDVDAFEVGAKSQLLGRRLLLTMAGFYQIYTNFQLNAFTGTQFIENTIPRAISEGVEFESYFRATPALTVNFGATYANTYYPNSAANQAVLGNSGPASPLYEATDLFRLPGSRLPFAPLWSVVAGAYYKHELAGPLIWTFSADGKYQSSYNIGSDHDPAKLQHGFAVFNARLGIGSADGRWTFEMLANNIFDQFYYQARFDGVIQTFSAPQPSSVPGLNNYYAFPGVPRMFGGTLRFKY